MLEAKALVSHSFSCTAKYIKKINLGIFWAGEREYAVSTDDVETRYSFMVNGHGIAS